MELFIAGKPEKKSFQESIGLGKDTIPDGPLPIPYTP